ncbi:MAG: HAD family hydrolase [Planctomycetota bacterium]
MSHTPIQTVIFDLGRVAVNIDFSQGLFRHLTAAPDESGDEVIARLCKNPLFIEYNSGRLSPEDFHRQVMDLTGLTLEFDAFRESWCNIFTMSEAMETLIREVSELCPIGVLSDTDPLHWEYLRTTFPVLQAAETPTLSFEVGAMKPAPEIYAAAVANQGVPAEACFFVDDLERNVEGAREAGLQSEVFAGAKALRKTLRERGLPLNEPA